MNQASTYKRCSNAAINRALQKHKAFVIKNAKVDSTATFQAEHPELRVLIKNHKKRANRWLARSKNTSLSNLSKWIHQARRACMQTTEKTWIDPMHYWYIHSEGSWVVNRHERVRQCMNKMNSDGITPPASGMGSYDLSLMYTTFEHKKLKELLDEYVELTFCTELLKSTNRKMLLLKKDGTFEWTNGMSAKDTTTTQHFDAKKPKEWIHFLINNLYVETGNAISKPTTGTAMGTSAAPMIANLAFLMAELKYVKMQASDIRHVGDEQWKLLRQLSFCNRYIDDLLNLCMDKTTFIVTLAMYSTTGLEIMDETGDNPHLLDYLDMTIWYSKKKKRMVSKMYDKRTLLQKKGLILNKFYHVESCLSTECSQCARFVIACSEPKYFLQAAVDLRATFVDKKYNIKKVDKRLARFMHKHRQQLRFEPNATQLKHEHKLQRKEQFISSIKSTYNLTNLTNLTTQS